MTRKHALLAAAVAALLALQPTTSASPQVEAPREKWKPAPAADPLALAQAEAGSAGEQDEGAGLPLAATRTIEIDTNEGTWLSLDVSPDGEQLVFELLGDLYTMPIEGGAATPILAGMAFQSMPVFSPDGSRIAYVSDESGNDNLWVADRDGQNAKALTSDEAGEYQAPEWSADGRYVFVTKLPGGIGANEIWMYNVLGGKGIQITNSKPKGDETPRSEQPNAMDASVSADGRYLYYSTKNGGFSYNQTSFDWQVVRRDLEEGTTDTIVTALGGALTPVVSPDGRQLVYATRYETETGFRVRDLVTGEDRWLAWPITHDDQESRATRGLVPAYAFLPDGSAVVANVGGRIMRIALADGATTEIPFSVSAELPVGPLLVNQTPDPQGPVVARLAQAPDLSPDGDTVVFSALGELYSMTLADGAEPRRIERAGSQAFQPKWSPDGRYLTYITWAPDGGHIWRMRANGAGRPQRVTQAAAYYTEPTFSPDGRKIFAIRSSNHQFNQGSARPQQDLVMMDLDGDDLRVVLPGGGVQSIHFGEDADRVRVYGPAGLISLRFDGTDRRTHIAVEGKGLYSATKPVPARDIKLSPDGTWALASSQQQLWLVAVPKFDRDGAKVDVGAPSVPVQQLSDIGVDSLQWSDDGRTVFWSVGATFFVQALDSVVWEEPEDEESAGEEADGEDTEAGDEAEDAPPLYRTYTARVEVPRDDPKGSLLLTGATVITMGPGGVLENADVLITDGRIAGVGAAGSVDVPADAATRDVSGKFIVPGFVDSHAHWRPWSRSGVIEPQFWPFLANLAHGVTSGLDVQTSTPDIFALQDMIEAGRMIGLRAWSTGPGVFSDNVFQDEDHALDVLTRYRDHYRTKNIKAYISGNRQQRQYIIQAAAELGIMPTTEGALDMKLDLTHIQDGFAGNEHNFPVFPLYDDVIQFTARSGIGYTGTLLVTYGGPWGENYFFTHDDPHDDPKVNRFMPHSVVDARTKRVPWFREEEYAFPEIAKSALDIQRAGGFVGVGSHGQFQGLGYHWELWALAEGSDDPMEALWAATIGGAHVIGHETEVGSIEVGKYADLVVLDSDPLEDIRNTADIHRVMMNGRLYDDDTLDQEWPEQKPLPPLWFTDQAPPGAD